MIAIGAGVVALALASYPLLRRRVEAEVAIDELVDGQVVKLTGRVHAVDSTSIAPLSGRAVVACRTVVRVPVPTNAGVTIGPVRVKSSYTPDYAFEDHVSVLHGTFAIEVSGGRVIVDPEHCEIRGLPLVMIPRPLAREVALLKQMQLAGTYPQVRGAPEPIFEEVVIEPNDVVTVCGIVVREVDPAQARERGYRDELGTRIRLAGRSADPLIIAVRAR